MSLDQIEQLIFNVALAEEGGWQPLSLRQGSADRLAKLILAQLNQAGALNVTE